MAVYEVVGSDGATYEVEGPAGISKAELARAVADQIASEEELERDQQALRDAQAAVREAKYGTKADEDISFFENVAKGFGAGAVDVGEMAALGGAAILGEESETAAREQIQAAAEAIRPEGGDQEAITYNLSKALGSIAGIAAPAALAAYAAPAAAATAVGTGVASLLAAGAGAGEASERAREAGTTEEQRSAATLRGVPIGLLDVLPMGRFVKAIDVPALTKIINKVGGENIETIGDKFLSVLGTAGFEGGQEAASGFLQNLNQAGYLSWEEIDLSSGIAEEAGYGAGAGGIIQMLVDFRRGRARAKAKRGDNTEPTDEEVILQLEDLREPPPPPPPPPLQLEGPPDFTVPPEGAPRTPEQESAEVNARIAAEREQELSDAEVDAIFGDMPAEEVRGQPRISPEDRTRLAQVEQERAVTEQERESAQLRAELAEDPTQMSAAFEEARTEQEAQQRTRQEQEDFIARSNAMLQEQQVAADLRERDRPEPPVFQDQPLPEVPRYTTESGRSGTLPIADPVQGSLPTLGRSFAEKQRDARRAERLSAPDPGEVITKEKLDELGVPARAPIRKRIEGKSLNDDSDTKNGTPRQQLATLAGNKKTSLNAKSKINQFLGDFPGAQRDIFETKPRAPRPRGPQEPEPEGPEGFDAPDTGDVAAAGRAQPITPETFAPMPTVEDEVAPTAAPEVAPEPIVEEEVTEEPVDDYFPANTGAVDDRFLNYMDIPIQNPTALGKHWKEYTLNRREKLIELGKDRNSKEVRDELKKYVDDPDYATTRQGKRSQKKVDTWLKMSEVYPDLPDVDRMRYFLALMTLPPGEQVTEPIVEEQVTPTPTPPPAAPVVEEEVTEQRVAPTEETGTDPVTRKFLDFLGLPTGPIRKRLKGTKYIDKGRDSAEVQKILRDYADTKGLAPEVGAAINLWLDTTPPLDSDVAKKAEADNRFMRLDKQSKARARRRTTTPTPEVKTTTTKAEPTTRPRTAPRQRPLRKGELDPAEARAEDRDYGIVAASTTFQTVVVPNQADLDGPGRVISLATEDIEIAKDDKQKIKKFIAKELTQDTNIIADEKKALAGEELKHKGRHKLSKEELIEMGEARAAQAYFLKHPDPQTALLVMAHDQASPPLNVEGEPIAYKSATEDTQETKDYFRNTGYPAVLHAVAWVQKNLNSTEQIGRPGRVGSSTISTQKTFSDLILAHNLLEQRAINEAAATTDIDHVEVDQERRARIEAQRQKEINEAEQERIEWERAQLSDEFKAKRNAEVNKKALYPDAVAGLDTPVHPRVGQLLREGNLREALRTLQTSARTGRVRQIAGVLAEVAGDTKVKVQNYVTDDVGKPVAGFFDPKTNTIMLDAETGINSHTILHEMTHAAVSHTLDNKLHPLTRQINTLFNDVKGSLDTAYGATNVDEFVSEAFSNPEFQQTLAGINPRGEPINALQRFFHSVRNFLRSLMGMPTKSLPKHLESAYVAVDGLINAMLGTAPKYRGAGAYYMAGISGGVWNTISNVVTKAKSVNSSDEAKGSWVNAVLKKMDDARLDNSVTGKAAVYYALYRALPLQAVVDFAVRRGLGKQAIKLQESIENFAGAVSEADRAVDGTAKIFADWIKVNKNDEKALTDFNEVVYESTVEQVDPSDRNGAKTYAGNMDKLKAWKGMQKAWGRLEKNGGDKVYMELRDSYARMYRDLKGVVERNIDELVTDEDARVELRRTVFTQMFEKNTIAPYFPLTRKGDFWLRYDAYDAETETTEPIYEAYEHISDRDRRIKELKKDDRVVENKDGEKAINEYTNLEQISFSNAPSGSFMQRVFKTLEESQPQLREGADAVERGAHDKKAKAHEDTKTQLMRLFINTLPETAFAKSMQKRGGPDNKGFRGFDRDAYDAFITRAYNLARQIEQLRYGNEIRSIEAEMREEFEKIKQKRDVNSHGVKLIVEELERRAMFARSPPNNWGDRMAARANRFAFLGTIGFNVSSAIVNASQIPLMMIPILNGEYSQGKYGLGDGAAISAVGRSSKLIASSTHLLRPGKRFSRKLSRIDAERGNIDVRGTPSIDNFYELKKVGDKQELVIRTDLNLSKEKIADLTRLKTLVEIAGNRGMLNRSLFYDTLSLEKSGRQRGLWDKVNAGSAFFFHLTERFNRQVAMMSTYDLELQRMREQGRDVSSIDVQTEAANVALRRAQEMNGGATLSTASGIAQRGWGRVAMMYKSYGVQMYYTLLKTGYQAMPRTSTDKWLAEERGMTLKEFQALDNTKKAQIREEDAALTQKAREQFIGVLLSSAFLAGVQGMPFVGAVMMMANLFRDDDEDDAETLLRKHIGELAYKGPVTAVFNTDISSRIGLSNLLYRDNPYSNDESPADRLMAVAGGPAWSVGAQFIRGATDVHRGHIERGVEGMLPAAFRNIYKGAPWVGRYARDEGILTRRGDIIHSDLGYGGLAAQFIGFPPTDYTLKQEQAQAFKRIDREVTDKSRRLRKLYYVALRMGDDPSDVLEEIYDFNKKHPESGITVGSLTKSVEAHRRTSALMHNGVTLSPKRRREIFESLGEYWDG